MAGAISFEGIDFGCPETAVRIEKVEGDEVSGIVGVNGSRIERPSQKELVTVAVRPTCSASKML